MKERDTHILKIVNNGRTFRKDVGITCFPEQTYGISEQAPDQMRRPFSLTAKNGYIYRYDQEHPSSSILQNEEDQSEQTNNKKINGINFSQKRYSSVVGNSISEVENFREIYLKQYMENGAVFRRKKGRLTEFMDKNGWMNKVVKIMGFQRTEAAREASNRDRQQRIQSLPKKKIFDNPVALKPVPKQLLTSSLMYKQKAKIRGQRFSFRQKNNQTLEIQRQIKTARDKFLQAQQMTNKMGRTSLDKDWKSTMNAVRQRSFGKPKDKFSLTSSDWKNNYKTVEVRTPNNLSIEVESEELKDWFNSTCNSSSNPWKYRKPRKVATNSSQEYNQNDE